MNVGNPVHAAILGIVAVGAVGFMGVRLLTHPPEARPPVARNASDATGPMPTMSLTLNHDPFSHEGLAEKPEPAVLVNAAKVVSSPSSRKEAPEVLPVLPGAIVPTLGPASQTPEVVPAKERPKNIRLKESAKAPVFLRVEATMIVKEPIAILSVDGSEARPLHVGDQVCAGATVLAIDGDGVSIGLHGRSVRISVGDEGRL